MRRPELPPAASSAERGLAPAFPVALARSRSEPSVPPPLEAVAGAVADCAGER